MSELERIETHYEEIIFKQDETIDDLEQKHQAAMAEIERWQNDYRVAHNTWVELKTQLTEKDAEIDTLKFQYKVMEEGYQHQLIQRDRLLREARELMNRGACHDWVNRKADFLTRTKHLEEPK